jgi:hypothetical protein
MREAHPEQLPQALVRVEAHPVTIGDRDQYEIQKLLQAIQSFVKSFPEETMIYPAEGTLDGATPIRTGGPRRGLGHSEDQDKGQDRRALSELVGLTPVTGL